MFNSLTLLVVIERLIITGSRSWVLPDNSSILAPITEDPIAIDWPVVVSLYCTPLIGNSMAWVYIVNTKFKLSPLVMLVILEGKLMLASSSPSELVARSILLESIIVACTYNIKSI